MKLIHKFMLALVLGLVSVVYAGDKSQVSEDCCIRGASCCTGGSCCINHKGQ